MIDVHPAVTEKLQHFEYGHLAEPLRWIAEEFRSLAHELAHGIASDPQLTIGLQHLIEAKDAVIRARVVELKRAGAAPGPNTPEPELTGGAR